VSPVVRSSAISGAGNAGQWGRGYLTPQNRYAGLTVQVIDDFDSLPDRLAEHFQKALVYHLEDAAQRVIDTARSYLVRLEEPPVMYADGREIHGYDTGTMYVSLKYELAEALLLMGVYYDLYSDQAPYWKFVEFGHWVFSAAGPWFWPGYHFFATAIEANEGYIRQRCREAWHDTAIKLAMESHVPGATGSQLGLHRGIGIGGVPNVAGVRP